MEGERRSSPEVPTVTGVRPVGDAQGVSWPRADALRSARLSLEPLAVTYASEMTRALTPLVLYRFTGGEPPTYDELEARAGQDG